MKCSFCKKDIEPGTGILYSLKDGTRFHFCGSKCEKNQIKLERKPRKLKWISTEKKEKKTV